MLMIPRFPLKFWYHPPSLEQKDQLLFAVVATFYSKKDKKHMRM